MFATGETVGLAKWIIDDTCLILTAALRNKLACLIVQEDEAWKEV